MSTYANPVLSFRGGGKGWPQDHWKWVISNRIKIWYTGPWVPIDEDGPEGAFSNYPNPHDDD